MAVPRLFRRIVEVYAQGGAIAVARQAKVKLRYVYARSTFRPHVIEKTLAGHRVPVAINNPFAQGWVEGRTEWPELVWVAEHFLRTGDVVIDCGANNGFTSMFFARCVGPTGRVIAFEPVPSNVADTYENLRLNAIGNVELRPQAVGSYNGEAMMADTPNGILGDSHGPHAIRVPMVRLDDALRGVTPSFIKVDVEGYELDVLSGGAEILRRRPCLDVEVHPLYARDRRRHVEAVLDFLQACQYELAAQPIPDGPIVPWDQASLSPARLAESDVFNLFAEPRGVLSAR